MKIINDIFDFCEWEQISPEQAQAYGYGSYFSELGMAESGEDLFGDIPDFFLHRGDITLDETVLLKAQGNGVFIVDGHLTGPHTFCFYCYDAYTFLLISGCLAVKNYVQGDDSQLGVRDALQVDETLWLNLSDAGFVLARGGAKAARHWSFDRNCAESADLANQALTKSNSSVLGIALDMDAGYNEAFIKEFPRKELTDVARALSRGIPVLNAAIPENEQA